MEPHVAIHPRTRPTKSAVRRIAPDEIHEVRQLLHEAAAWSRAFGQPIWSEEELDRSTYGAVPLEQRWFGAFDRGGLIACMRMDAIDPIHWPDDPPGDAVYIHKLAVARRAAGRGWPARLIDAAAAIATRLDVRFLRLDTAPREKLIALYRGLGFRIVDERPGLFAGRELVRLERHLSHSRLTAPAATITRRAVAAFLGLFLLSIAGIAVAVIEWRDAGGQFPAERTQPPQWIR